MSLIKIRTPLEAVSALSGREVVNIEFDQTNRYCISTKEDRLKRAFCFGVPVIHESTNRIVIPQFVHDRGATLFSGGNSDIRIDSSVKMKSTYGECEIVPEGTFYKRMRNSVFFKSKNCQSEIFPTVNGVAVKF